MWLSKKFPALHTISAGAVGSLGRTFRVTWIEIFSQCPSAIFVVLIEISMIMMSLPCNAWPIAPSNTLQCGGALLSLVFSASQAREESSWQPQPATLHGLAHRLEHFARSFSYYKRNKINVQAHWLVDQLEVLRCTGLLWYRTAMRRLAPYAWRSRGLYCSFPDTDYGSHGHAREP